MYVVFHSNLASQLCWRYIKLCELQIQESTINPLKFDWKTTCMASQSRICCLWSHRCCFSFKPYLAYCAGAISYASFLDLFGPIAGVTNPTVLCNHFSYEFKAETSYKPNVSINIMNMQFWKAGDRYLSLKACLSKTIFFNKSILWKLSASQTHFHKVFHPHKINKPYPQLPWHQKEKGTVTVLRLGRFSLLMVRWVYTLF